MGTAIGEVRRIITEMAMIMEIRNGTGMGTGIGIESGVGTGIRSGMVRQIET